VRKFADSLVLILNVLVALGLILSYLAPLINPAKLFFPALFGLAYPYMLLANLLFICYWLIRLRKEIFISILVILIGWNHLNNTLPLNFRDVKIPETSDVDQMFKVLSYNVRGFDVYNWTPNRNIKKEIFSFLQNQKPDILCFQEYYTSHLKPETHQTNLELLPALNENAVYYSTGVKNKYGFGIATFSKFPIVKKSRIPFNSTHNAAMYTDILFGNDTFRVFNIHLQSIKFHQENYAFLDSARLKYSNEQIREIKEIGSRLKTAFTMRSEQAQMISNYIKDSPHPVVVLGDFNDTPQSYAYRRIKKGMQDAFREAGRGFGNTYAGELPSLRIDYILCSEPLIPYQFNRIKTDYSDHFPITTWLYFPERSISE
jgi:endonuclease/exonuclease/phosphatase family metal-dependent hydrolase